jgi:transposase
MPNTKINSHNNTRNPQNFQLSLPMNVDYFIGDDESIRTLIEITERLDYSKLNASYKRLPKKEDATPKQMFQLVILGFMNGTYSLRGLESRSRYDIRFLHILKGKPAPDHNRFWSFIKHRLQGEVIENLFYQLVHYLKETGEIDLVNLFVDGTKIEANANRYSFVWKKSTNKFEARLDVKIETLKEALLVSYPFLIKDDMGLEDCLNTLRAYAKDSGLTFVYGRGRRKTQLQRDVELLTNYTIRKTKYEGYNRTFKGRNNFSKTDTDATFMRMKDDHMMNGQLKPGYNLQLGVEGEYIVGVDVTPERSDVLTLLPLLDRMEAGIGARHKNVVADAGYESEENYKGLVQREQTSYIKPQNYELSKKKKYKNNAYLRENMTYDETNDTYTCPNGNLFTYSYTRQKKSRSGFVSEVSVYECSGCHECPLKSNCTKAKNNRQLHVSKDFVQLRQAALQLITSDEGKELRMNRSIQVEGAFGVLKQDYGFRRLLRRKTEGVTTEIFLYAFAFNINKRHNKNEREFEGVIKHELKTS